jgi:N-acetyl-1-D-myo-inositol-2-amino-2-deoxy-alpha-D-glucopyranoside deacetylase
MSRRLLLVHAHPDDEVLATGATIAHESARGTRVTLVTCVRGELGEIVVDELAHLASDRDDKLGELREEEMAAACEALGITDHRWLGGLGRWRDSDMVGRPGNDDPRSFWQADVGEAGKALAEVMREVRPQVVVTYDEIGGYGHPDHIQAHRVTNVALDLVAGEGLTPKVYWPALPVSLIQLGVEIGMIAALEDVPTVPDELITTVIDGRDVFDAKVAGMRAHRSQIDLEEGMFAPLAAGVADRVFGIEHYRLVRGELGPTDPQTGKETDLFAGLPAD